MEDKLNLWAITLDFLGFLLGKIKDFLLKSLEYLFTGIIFVLYYGIVYGIVDLIFFPFWIKDAIKNLFNLINDFLQNHPKEIYGTVVKVEEKDEKLFFPVIEYNNSYQSTLFLPFSEPILVHRYILTVKNNMETYTVRVPFDFYRNVKKQIRKGVKNISLSCRKNDFEDVYDLYNT